MIENRKNLIKHIPTEQDMLVFAARFAKCVSTGAMIFLEGPLGAGKTTFTRGFLQGMGYAGKVKSPTYTLIETYKFKNRIVHHFDFYRLHDTRELEYIGIHEYFERDSISLIEWPERGISLLPDADIMCHFTVIEEGRKIRIAAMSDKGERILRKL